MLFTKTKLLEQKVEQYLDRIADTGLHFKEGVRLYLNGKKDKFEERIELISSAESDADDLRREIESELYTNTLIPESRGDVLALLETIDNVANRAKETMLEFSIEIPNIPKQFHDGYLDLTEAALKALESIVKTTRAFFRDVNSVNEHLHKVYFYEKEADRAGENLKREIFQTDLVLSHKTHLRYFALHIDLIADYAEDVADRLSIYSIKRSI